eukprot:scaffold31245_cov115-Isochrysis_galbana.AAC.2
MYAGTKPRDGTLSREKNELTNTSKNGLYQTKQHVRWGKGSRQRPIPYHLSITHAVRALPSLSLPPQGSAQRVRRGARPQHDRRSTSPRPSRPHPPRPARHSAPDAGYPTPARVLCVPQPALPTPVPERAAACRHWRAAASLACRRAQGGPSSPAPTHARAKRPSVHSDARPAAHASPGLRCPHRSRRLATVAAPGPLPRSAARLSAACSCSSHSHRLVKIVLVSCLSRSRDASNRRVTSRTRSSAAAASAWRLRISTRSGATDCSMESRPV